MNDVSKCKCGKPGCDGTNCQCGDDCGCSTGAEDSHDHGHDHGGCGCSTGAETEEQAPGCCGGHHHHGPTDADLAPFMVDLGADTTPLEALRAGPGADGPVRLAADLELEQREDGFATEILAVLHLGAEALVHLERVDLVLRDGWGRPVDAATHPVDEPLVGEGRIACVFDLPPGVLAHATHAELVLRWRAEVDAALAGAIGETPALPADDARVPWSLEWASLPVLGRAPALRTTAWTGRMVGEPFFELLVELADSQGREASLEVETHLLDAKGATVLSTTDRASLSAADRCLLRPSFTLSESAWSRVRGVGVVARGAVLGSTSLGTWSLA